MKPDGLSTEERDRAWNAITAVTVAARPAVRGKNSVLSRSLFTKATTLLVICAILLGSAATASAHNAMPGDWLFPVKIAAEKAQVLLARDAQQKEALRIKFAEARLAEVRALLDITLADPAVTSALASSTNETVQATTTTPVTPIPTAIESATGTSASSTETVTLYLPAPAIRKIERAERAIVIALRELEETRAKLAREGSADGVFVLDEIIAELKGTGNDAVTITKITASTNAKKGDKEKVTIRATFSPMSATTTATSSAFVGTVAVDGRKNGTRIIMRSPGVKTEIALRAHSPENTPERELHTNNDHNDDGDIRKDNDKKNREKLDKKKTAKKITICHHDGNNRHTTEISVSAVRAHLAHGDVLGKCTHENSDDDSDADDDNVSDTVPPELSIPLANPGTTTVIITLTTNEPARTELFIGTTNPPVTTTPNAVGRFTSVHSYKLAGLSSGTTYHYLVAAIDRFGNRATSSQGTFTTGSSGTSSPPLPSTDTAAPEISAIDPQAGTTSATITWLTNEATKNRIWLATTSPVATNVDPAMEETAFVMGHSASFSGLMSGTTYYFLISADDAAGNQATSSERSFTTITLPPPDTTAPSFTSITGAASGTEATISWVTDEPARATLYFSASDPLDLGTASTLSFTNLALDHEALLSGLSASTTYRYRVVAEDATGNTATSSEHSFVTQ